MIPRSCKLPEKQSAFLFGARGVGKTTLLQQLFSKKEAVFIDLLDIRLFDQLTLDPGRFADLINTKTNQDKVVIVDEIQKIPQLLDVAHQQIQKTKRQFIFTGSSSRRLKQKGVNLLGGRAWVYHLYPFTREELGQHFDLKTVLERGVFPEAIWLKTKNQHKNIYELMLALIYKKKYSKSSGFENLSLLESF